MLEHNVLWGIKVSKTGGIRILGHQDIAMTQRYAHLAADDLKRATEGVSKMLDNAA